MVLTTPPDDAPTPGPPDDAARGVVPTSRAPFEAWSANPDKVRC